MSVLFKTWKVRDRAACGTVSQQRDWWFAAAISVELAVVVVLFSESRALLGAGFSLSVNSTASAGRSGNKAAACAPQNALVILVASIGRRAFYLKGG
jgi:hypothetical protein